MALDIAEHIGLRAKTLMELVQEIDGYAPDEGTVEVLIDAFGRWSQVETRLLFPALESYAEDETFADKAAERIAVLERLRDNIRLEEGADAPYSELASKYVAGIKYHLIVDVEDILPLALLVPEVESRQLLARMQKLDSKLMDGEMEINETIDETLL